MLHPNQVSQKLFLGSAVASVALSGAAPMPPGSYALSLITNNESSDAKHSVKTDNRAITVSHLQTKLKEKQLYKKEIDGVYGVNTQAAIIRYQKEKGLRVDGKAGPKTHSSLSAGKGHYVAADKLVRERDHGPAVRSIQKKLKDQGYYSYTIDGKFGQKTEKAVKTFQSEQGLQIDGIVGPQTRAALDNQHKDAKEKSSDATPKTKTKSAKVHTSANHSGLMAEAKSLQGTPYKWGGDAPGGFDCSGFIQYVFKKHGIKLPRSVSEIWNYGIPVQHPQKGDLVFFETYKAGPSHVGIYMGHGQFLSATDDGVKTSAMSLDYWQSHYLGAKRITQTH